MRQVKEIKEIADVTCENCVWYNEGECVVELPINTVEPDNRCGEGSWICDGIMSDFENICVTLKYHKVIETVEDIKCKHCLYYYPNREECHRRRTAYYRTQANDWCGEGWWLYNSDKDIDYSNPFGLYRMFNEQINEEVGESDEN